MTALRLSIARILFGSWRHVLFRFSVLTDGLQWFLWFALVKKPHQGQGRIESEDGELLTALKKWRRILKGEGNMQEESN